MSKKAWLLVGILFLATNATSWNRAAIAKLFEVQNPAKGINVGVLIPDEDLSADKEENIALARSLLSKDYHWRYVPDEFGGKVPLPWSPFTECTGFHFQPVSPDQKSKPQLALRQ